jgi:hypothetical protein
MKSWLKIFLTGLVLVAVPALGIAQTNSVSVTRIVTGTAESVTSVTASSTGSGYTSAPTVTFSGGGGAGATATATLSNGVVGSLTISAAGSGYTSGLVSVTISGGGGSGALATATVTSGAISALTVTNGGSGYTSAPTVTIANTGAGAGTGATATANVSYSVTGYTVTNGGSAYTSAPTVTITGGGGSGATATAVRGSTGQAFSNPNEAYGAAGTTIYISALGTGTFPAAGWSYDFKVNGVSVGVTSSIPGGTTSVSPWSPPQPGTYFISVTATGIGAPVTSLAVRYFATGTAITSPVNGSIVPNGSSVVIEATATPQPLGNGQNAFVQKIDFFADGSSTPFATDSVAPFSAVYTPTTLGTHTIEAKAYDNLGQQISANGTATRSLTVVTPVGTPPTVAISSPANNSTVAVPESALTVSVDASPGTSRITQVELYVDGVLFGTDVSFPYSFSWAPTVVGTYQLSALAYDQSGNVVASSINSVQVSAPEAAAGASTASSASAGTSYIGTYSRLSGTSIESGNFALVTVGTKTATLIAYSITSPYKTYYYSGGTVDSTGHISIPATSDLGALTATAADSGVNGTFDGTRATFIGQVWASSSTSVPAGYYQGYLNGKSDSRIVGIVSADGQIYVYGSDGSFVDAGSGTVSSTASFSFTTKSGTIFSGTASSSTGLITGTMTVAGAAARSFTGAVIAGAATGDGVLRGLSTRGFVGSGDQVMVAGFVVSGSANKQVVVRGMGPSIAGVGGTLANPKLEIYNSSNALVTSNDDWINNSSNIAVMNGVGLAAPGSALESFVAPTLAPGVYTAQLSGVSGATGIGLVEVYDGSSFTASTTNKITAISTRGYVNTGSGALIAGFVVNGTTAKKVLIQAVGPSLSIGGLLADPTLQLIKDGQVVRENDNWETGNDRALMIDAASRSGATGLAAGGKDAAILVNLNPGTYTAVVTGVGSSTGIALINVYEVP